MRIADAISNRTEVVHHGLAISEDRLEYGFLMLEVDPENETVG